MDIAADFLKEVCRLLAWAAVKASKVDNDIVVSIKRALRKIIVIALVQNGVVDIPHEPGAIDDVKFDVLAFVECGTQA